MEDIPLGSLPLDNEQHERLAQGYFETANKKIAGERAGYADKSNAWRAIHREDVQARIKFLQDERAEELGLDAYYVLKNLKSIAERCMQGEPVTDRDGAPVFIQGGDGEYAALYKFDAPGATKAVELIGKHIGMFKDKIEHDISDPLKELLQRASGNTLKPKG